MRIWSVALASAVVVAALLVPAQAFAEDPPPPDPPIDATTVPPLVSEPLIVPPSTLPVGDFGNCCAPAPAPAPTPMPEFVIPPPAWTMWTPEQRDAIMQITRYGGGSSYNIVTAPDGSLLIQDVTGFMVDSSPNPWVLMGLDGSSALLAPSTPRGAESLGGSDPTLRMDVPTSAGVSFIATNTSPVAAMVLITWEVGSSRVSRWKNLDPGEVWMSQLEAPEGASTTTAGVLITQSTSRGSFENNMVGIVAAGTND